MKERNEQQGSRGVVVVAVVVVVEQKEATISGYYCLLIQCPIRKLLFLLKNEVEEHVCVECLISIIASSLAVNYP